MIPIKNPALRTVLNFLMLPAAIILCYGAAWFLAIYPTQHDPKITIAESFLALVKFEMMFYYSSIAISLAWIVYMSLSFKTFRDNLVYFRINVGILVICTCILTYAAIYMAGN